MAKLVGHKTKIEFGARTVSVTGEALSAVDSTTYQIADETKRFMDPLGAVTVYEDGSETSQDVAIDYLFGTIQFPTAPTEPVTADFTYIPRVKLACPRSVSINVSRDNHDTTCMDPETSARRRQMALKDVSISSDILEETPLYQEYDLAGESKSLEDLMDDNSIPKIFSAEFTDGSAFRSFVVLPQHESDSDFENLVESGVEWEGSARGNTFYSWSNNP